MQPAMLPPFAGADPSPLRRRPAPSGARRRAAATPWTWRPAAATAVPAPCQAISTPATAGPSEGRGTEGPAAHHIGGGELVGRLDHGGEHGRLRWPRRGEAQRGQGRQNEDDDDRRAQADGCGDTSHGHSLERVAPAEHVVRAVLVRERTQEGPEHDARHQLNEHHGGSRRRTPVAIGINQQSDPDAQLRHAEKRVGEPDSAQRGVRRGRAQDGDDSFGPKEHGAIRLPIVPAVPCSSTCCTPGFGMPQSISQQDERARSSATSASDPSTWVG